MTTSPDRYWCRKCIQVVDVTQSQACRLKHHKVDHLPHMTYVDGVEEILEKEDCAAPRRLLVLVAIVLLGALAMGCKETKGSINLMACRVAPPAIQPIFIGVAR